MKRILRSLITYCTTADSLFLKRTEIWKSIPAEYFKNLIVSMGSRCRAPSNVRVGARKYLSGRRSRFNWLNTILSSIEINGFKVMSLFCTCINQRVDIVEPTPIKLEQNIKNAFSRTHTPTKSSEKLCD